MKRARIHTAVWVAGLYFVAMAIGVTFPGVAPFNTVRPFVLGIPFVFAWYLGWIVGALFVFYFLHRSTER
ncbi:MAG TPA: hypothetical protein VGA37_10270 [Gemmatimonadales bacterium]